MKKDLTVRQKEILQYILATIKKSGYPPSIREIGKAMGIKTGVFQALKSKRGLEREYETLFGDRTRPGQLATMFKFDYGKIISHR